MYQPLKASKLLFALVFSLILTVPLKAQLDFTMSPAEKLGHFLEMLERGYLNDVNSEELTETAIKSMLKDLDPHSIYISAEDVKKMNEPLVGNFEGIGIQFNIHHDTIMVITPISGGPSEKLGIRSGDRIVRIEGENVAGNGVTDKDVVDKLRGTKGTKVNVDIKRKGVKDLIPFTITRDKIPLFSLDASHMLNDNVGFIKLNRFASTTVQEFKESLSELQSKGMRDLILDLRGNGGGYLRAAVELADEFVKGGELIVYTEGRRFPRKDYKSTRAGNFKKGKVVVLIDEGSASASEIVSGALQDWDRGLVVGRRSFGKGLVQQPFYFRDGSMLRLTTAQYFTPSGRYIQKPFETGEEGIKAYHKERLDRLERGELSDEDLIELPDSLKFFTSSKRVVYGGGGIMPDVFVGLDTSFNTSFYRDLIRKGIVYDLTLDYADLNRQDLLSTYPTVAEFVAKFSENELYEKLLAKAADQEIEVKDAEVAASEIVLRNQLKALVARHLWKTNAFYQVMNQSDETVQKALEVLKDDTFKRLSIN